MAGSAHITTVSFNINYTTVKLLGNNSSKLKKKKQQCTLHSENMNAKDQLHRQSLGNSSLL
jgi:hypothetical protein